MAKINGKDVVFSPNVYIQGGQSKSGIDFDSNTRVSYIVGLTIPLSDTSFNFNPLLMPELAITVE